MTFILARTPVFVVLVVADEVYHLGSTSLPCRLLQLSHGRQKGPVAGICIRLAKTIGTLDGLHIGPDHTASSPGKNQGNAGVEQLPGGALLALVVQGVANGQYQFGVARLYRRGTTQNSHAHNQ